jgi:hypothetical protein
LRAFENREWRRIFGPIVTCTFKSRRMRWVGQAVHMGEIRDACKILVGKAEGKTHLIGPGR